MGGAVRIGTGGCYCTPYSCGYCSDDNLSLTSLSGLDNLTTIGGSLEIGGYGALTSLTGLDGLTSVQGDLYLAYNDALTSLSGLDSLVSVGGNLYIYENNSLPSLSGLGSLTSVGVTCLLATAIAPMATSLFAICLGT